MQVVSSSLASLTPLEACAVRNRGHPLLMECEARWLAICLVCVCVPKWEESWYFSVFQSWNPPGFSTHSVDYDFSCTNGFQGPNILAGFFSNWPGTAVGRPLSDSMSFPWSHGIIRYTMMHPKPGFQKRFRWIQMDLHSHLLRAHDAKCIHIEFHGTTCASSMAWVDALVQEIERFILDNDLNDAGPWVEAPEQEGQKISKRIRERERERE